MEPSLFPLLNGCTQINSPTGSCHGPRNSQFVSLVWLLPAAQSSTWRLAMDFYCFCRLSPNYTYLTCRNFVCQHSVMAKTTVKQPAFFFYRVQFPTCIGIPGFIYIGAIFSTVNIRQCHIPTCQDSARMWFTWQRNSQCSCLDLFPRSICFYIML